MKSRKSKDKEQSNIKNYFLSVLGRYNLRNKEQFTFFCKWLIFIVVLVVEVFILLVFLSEQPAHSTLISNSQKSVLISPKSGAQSTFF